MSKYFIYPISYININYYINYINIAFVWTVSWRKSCLFPCKAKFNLFNLSSVSDKVTYPL